MSKLFEPDDPNNEPIDTSRPMTRMEREIDEILRQSQAPIPITAKARSTGWRAKRLWKSYSPRIAVVDTFWGWLLIAVAIYLAGGRVFDQSGLGWQATRMLGLVALFAAIYRIFKPRYRAGQKIWRGHLINMNKRGVELGDKWDEWRKGR